MKQYGFVGKGTGKLGASVFAISGGEQIVRQYNPVVSNPNTEAQIAQRAKLKLMSQLAAVLAAALGFAKQGLVSARNQFVSKNIGLATFENNEAQITLTDVQLTNSQISLPALRPEQVLQGTLIVKLADSAAADIKRVVYVVYEKQADNTLRYVASQIVSDGGASNDFPATFNTGEMTAIVYAYGVKDNSVDATIRYENYVAPQAGQTATLDVISLFRTGGYGLTKSVALEVTIEA